MSEPTMIKSENAYIMPYNRNKGGLGYVIAPLATMPNRTLTADEMAQILALYTALLKGETNEQTE